MSIRHRVNAAIRNVDKEMNYAHATYSTDSALYLVFEQERSAQIIAAMLKHMLKSKPLIHNGRKPR